MKLVNIYAAVLIAVDIVSIIKDRIKLNDYTISVSYI
jgi:hypothetical protein